MIMFAWCVEDRPASSKVEGCHESHAGGPSQSARKSVPAMVLALSEQPTPEFEASLAAAAAEAQAAKKCAELLASSSRAVAKALASRVDVPHEGLAKFSSMLVRT